jgi:RES domain-containing protein
LACFNLRFEERLVTTLEQLPPDWRQIPAPSSTQELGAEWCNSGRSAVLRAPSVIIPSEYNFVLNPAHPDYKQIEIGPAEPFSIDPRLLGSSPSKGPR